MKYNFTFAKHYKRYFMISAVVLAIGLGVLLTMGFNLGNEFKGGSKLQIRFNEPISESQIKDDIASFNLAPDVISASNLENEYIIKTSIELDNDQRREIFDVLATKYKLNEDGKYTNLRSSSQIGATIGKDSMNKAMNALLYASIGILLYITFRFEWKFGVAAIVSLVHDILILCVVYLVFRIPLDSSFIAAVLTVLGYSINDDIVLFDRIRDELKYTRVKDLYKLCDNCINMTLGRTINTSLTTIVVIVALYIFGVDALKSLSFPLIVGILVGTYSTIFIASPVWVLLNERFGENKSSNVKKKIKAKNA